MRPTQRMILAALLLLVALPAGLLAVRCVDLFQPRPLMVSELVGGVRILSIPLDQDKLEVASGWRRHQLADGSVRNIRQSDLVRQQPAVGVWMLRSEEAPPRLGWIDGVVVGADTLRGGGWEGHLEELRRGQRQDRDALVAAVRQARTKAGFSLAMERWNLFRKADEGIGLLVRDADGSRTLVRLSSLREISEIPQGALARAAAWVGRIAAVLWETPDSWGLGGLRQALVSTIALIVLAGLIGGTFAILAALLLAERLRPGRWALIVRRSSEWLAAVPGVVWGGVGLGVLVLGVGARLDLVSGSGVRWATGGLLWASLTLGILAVPLSLTRALEVLDGVPRQWRLVARSCGATRFQVLHMVVLPSAWPGLLGAWLSAFARAAGETAPLILVGAVHSIGGDVLETGFHLPPLSGGFAHLGVLACDPPWTPLEAEQGHPVAFLALLVLTLLCIGFELAAVGLFAKGRQFLAKQTSR